MLTHQRFKNGFGQREMPEELVKLWNLQDQVGQKFLSDGFELTDLGNQCISAWSSEEEFLDRLIGFAQANGSGSIYALWLMDPQANLNQQPVVVFGDEGGIHLVAENILQLLHLLSYDSEPYIDHASISFGDKDDHEASEGFDQYIAWLKNNFQLDPIDDPDKLIGTAQDHLKGRFKEWIRNFVEGEE